MGGKGKRRQQSNQHGGSLAGKKQKQSQNKGKDDGEGSSIVLSRSKKASSGSVGLPIPGLMNLGNTCFFNSVMQNLAQTHYLRQRMKDILTTEKLSIVLPSPKESLPSLSLSVDSKPGKFAEDFHKFIEEMRHRPKQPLNPRTVFNHVCKNAPRFGSYQQQDSQELLRYLLDALRNEEVYRIKKAILEYYNVKGRNKDATTSLPESEKKAIKAYGVQALQQPTFVEDVFGGKIMSSITCLECKTSCEMEEGFLDLSLPVPSESVMSGFRSSLKNKKRAVRNSSEDAEGDDEGEGFHYGHQKVKNKEDPVKISKHQMKHKRKEERKRSKTNKQRYSLDQFQKEKFDENKEILLEEPSTPSIISRSVSMDTHDSCQADDEVTFQSTQQDSDSSSALNLVNIGDSNTLDTQQVTQNFTRSSSSDDKTDNQSEGVVKGVVEGGASPVDTLNEKVQDMSLDDGNQNLSASVVAMFESKETKDLQEDMPLQKNLQEDTPLHKNLQEDTLLHKNVQEDTPLHKDLQEDTPLHSPMNKTVDNNIEGNPQFTSLDNDNAQDEDGVKLDSKPRTVSITNVTASLENIEDLQNLVKNQQEPQNDQKDAGDIEQEQDNSSSNPVPINPSNLSNNNNSPKHKKKFSPAKQVEKHSLEYCLEQFSSSELLSGSERFYCDSCSRQSTERRTPLRAKPPNTSRPLTDTNMQTTTLGDEDCKGLSSDNNATNTDDYTGGREQLTALVEREEVSSPETSVSSVSSSASCKEDDEDTEMLESTKESDDNMDNISQCSSGEDGDDRVILRDAIKQMLVARPPPVLCLHLKRFIQQGRNFKNMKKNNCFISFPLILDIGPYCTAKYKTIGGDQILYSLYGVVVHGGGLHGGHYTAFIRVRNELNLKDVITTPSSTVREDTRTYVKPQTTNDDVHVNQPASSVDGNNTQITDETDGATAGTDGATMGTDRATAGTDEATMGTDEATMGTDGATVGTDGATMRTDGATMGTDGATMGTDGATVATGSTLPSCNTAATPESIPAGTRETFEYDLSSTEGGTWYHISDSHVRKSTEAEALRAEAYLLFYERLPCTMKNV